MLPSEAMTVKVCDEAVSKSRVPVTLMAPLKHTIKSSCVTKQLRQVDATKALASVTSIALISVTLIGKLKHTVKSCR